MSPTEVGVHWLPLSADPARYPVTAVETVRAARYRRDEDRRRSLLAAGLLRAVLAGPSGADPLALHVDRSCAGCGEQHGRPVVAGGPHLSVTHAGAWVGVAVSRSWPVGVDVEPADAVVPATAFAPGEPRQDPVRTWVAKEAWLKATGDGLTVDPATVVLRDLPTACHVDPDDRHRAAVVTLAGVDAATVRTWS